VRVVFNRLSTLGNRTGVGHYAAQLLARLREQAGADDIACAPSGWVWHLGRFRHRLRPPASGDRAGRASEKPSGQGRLLRSLQAVLDAGRFDLYHEPNNVPLPCDRPTLATVHDLSVLLHPEWHPAGRVAEYERNWYRAVRQCRHFLAVSDFTRREMIRTLNLPPERVTRVYNGIRPGLGPLPSEAVAAARRRLRLPQRYLLCVSTVEPRKNLGMLLRAYCALPAALRSGWPLVLAGGRGWKDPGVAEFLQSEARHRGVLPLGYVADRDLAALYNGARALVYPSLYEGFGLPPVEMMACGGAVLASTAGALVETVGAYAHLIEPDDLDGWRDGMRRVVADDEWWRSLRRGVLELARTYTWSRCAGETWRVYRAVAAGKLPRVPAKSA
jgi:alpha-1,3-rhamnosyl/mannosyltransferase